MNSWIMGNEQTTTPLKYLGCKNKWVIKMVICGTFYMLAVLQKSSHILGYLTLTTSMRYVLRHQFITGETDVQKA